MKNMLEGKAEGRYARDQSWYRLTDNVRKWTSLNLVRCTVKMGRASWRTFMGEATGWSCCLCYLVIPFSFVKIIYYFSEILQIICHFSETLTKSFLWSPVKMHKSVLHSRGPWQDQYKRLYWMVFDGQLWMVKRLQWEIWDLLCWLQ